MSIQSSSKINNQKLLNIILSYKNFEEAIDKKLVELTNINDKSRLLSEWYKILVKTEDVLNNNLYQYETKYKFRKISYSTNSNNFMMTPNYKRNEYKYKKNRQVAINFIDLYNNYMKNILEKKLYIERKYIEIYPKINVSNFYNNYVNNNNVNNNNVNNNNGNNNNGNNNNGNNYYGNSSNYVNNYVNNNNGNNNYVNNNNGNNKNGNNNNGNNNNGNNNNGNNNNYLHNYYGNSSNYVNNNVNNKTIIRNNNTRTNHKQCCTISGGKKKKL